MHARFYEITEQGYVYADLLFFFPFGRINPDNATGVEVFNKDFIIFMVHG
jgi:hypothetical protein